jgi:hypothetical protein
VNGRTQVRRLRASQAVLDHRLAKAAESGRTLREKLRTMPRTTLVATGLGLGLLVARMPARAVLAVVGGVLTIGLRVLSAPLIGPVAVGAIMARRKQRAGHDAGTDERPR